MFCAILFIGTGNFHGRHVSRFANNVIKILIRLLHIDLASLIAAGASRKSAAWHLELPPRSPYMSAVGLEVLS